MELGSLKAVISLDDSTEYGGKQSYRILQFYASAISTPNGLDPSVCSSNACSFKGGDCNEKRKCNHS